MKQPRVFEPVTRNNIYTRLLNTICKHGHVSFHLDDEGRIIFDINPYGDGILRDKVSVELTEETEEEFFSLLEIFGEEAE